MAKQIGEVPRGASFTVQSPTSFAFFKADACPIPIYFEYICSTKFACDRGSEKNIGGAKMMPAEIKLFGLGPQMVFKNSGEFFFGVWNVRGRHNVAILGSSVPEFCTGKPPYIVDAPDITESLKHPPVCLLPGIFAGW